MSLNAQIVDQRVRRIAAEHHADFIGEVGIRNDETRLRSVAFVLLAVRTLLDLSHEDAVDSLVEGGQDFGVDAIYATPPHDGEIVVTIFQGKYKQDLGENGNFPENGVVAALAAVGALFDPGCSVNVNKRLKAKVEEIRSLVAAGAIPRVHVVLCNNGIQWTDNAQVRIDQAGYGDQVTWQHVGPSQLLALLQATKPVNDTLQLTGKAVVESFDFRRALVGKLATGQLAALFDRHGDRLLERNIRRYLGLSGNRVNEAVAATLRDPQQRQNFYFYNNGITIICSKFRHNALQQDNWQVQVDGLQIVNGGQTSKTVQQVVREIGPEAAEAQVLVRIYELPQEDDELVRSITYATNSQNPVDLRDLRSNDGRQKKLGQAVEALGYAYRRQRGEQTQTTKDLTSASVAEAVLAVWCARPHQARFMASEHFGKLYDIIFTDHLNAAQAVTAALLLRFAENRRKRPPADAPDFFPYASRFIAMLMGRYLLADIGVPLASLDHRNFAAAEKLIEEKAESYFQRALEQISGVLASEFTIEQRTLQRLSATFRRPDLVQTLIGGPFTAPRIGRATTGTDITATASAAAPCAHA